MAQVNIDIAKEESVQQVKTISDATKSISESVVSAIGTSSDVGETTVMGKLNAMGSSSEDILKYMFSPPVINVATSIHQNNTPITELEKILDVSGEGALYYFSTGASGRMQVFIDGDLIFDILGQDMSNNTVRSVFVGSPGAYPAPNMFPDIRRGSRGGLVAPVHFKETLVVYVAHTSTAYDAVSLSYGLY